MCVISNVMDGFNPWFPQTVPAYPTTPTDPPIDWSKIFAPQPAPDLTEMRTLIEQFKEAVEAAKRIDVLMKQPDCIDPDKAKLFERVDRLEKIIDALAPRDKDFRVGALVKWTSQAAGRSKEKLGTIEAIIPAGKRPELKGCGYQRDHESYVVRVTERWPNGNVRSTRLYWPHVRNLEMA